MNTLTSWLEEVPDKYAVMLKEGKIDYDKFLELTEQYQPMQVRVLIMLNKKKYIKHNMKGLDLIG